MVNEGMRMPGKAILKKFVPEVSGQSRKAIHLPGRGPAGALRSLEYPPRLRRRLRSTNPTRG
jgi:hypothetical protein